MRCGLYSFFFLTIDGNPFRICEGEKTKRYREPWLNYYLKEFVLVREREREKEEKKEMPKYHLKNQEKFISFWCEFKIDIYCISRLKIK